MRTIEYHIEQANNNIIVGDYLKKVHGYSRRMLIRLKNDLPSIKCNEKHIRMVDRLRAGDILKIIMQEEGYIEPNDLLIADIAYEDEDVIIFNKPFDMPVHPSRNHQFNTLANVFASHCKRSGLSLLFRPINRLDRDTSGLCIVAKNPLSAAKLSGKTQKQYLAIVAGTLTPPVGSIVAPIRRVADSGILREVGEDGQEAITHYQTVESNGLNTLLAVTLETGRTHQIRVHFSHIGHPLVGDSMYGGDCSQMKRQALHCEKVWFTHPTKGTTIEVDSKMPLDFIETIQKRSLLV